MDCFRVRNTSKYESTRASLSCGRKLRVSMLDMKFVLLHDAKGDDGVKSFFMDVWELYIKVGGPWS